MCMYDIGMKYSIGVQLRTITNDDRLVGQNEDSVHTVVVVVDTLQGVVQQQPAVEVVVQ